MYIKEKSSLSEHDQQQQEKKLISQKNTRLQLFEYDLALTKKGSYVVWKTFFKLQAHLVVPIYLHAVNDNKIVYRLSNRYGPLPSVPMSVNHKDPKTNKRAKITIDTSQAHRCYRRGMGFNDQSDGKRSSIGLSAKYYKRWPQKLIAKTLEDAIINGYLNYLLDPSCSTEPWPVFLHWMVQEFIVSGENLRIRGKDHKFRRIHKPVHSLRPVSGSEANLSLGEKCPGRNALASIKQVPSKDRTRVCAFCGRARAMYRCRSCSMHLCMIRPQGENFPAKGPSCFLRFHGIHK